MACFVSIFGLCTANIVEAMQNDVVEAVNTIYVLNGLTLPLGIFVVKSTVGFVEYFGRFRMDN